MTDSGTRRSGIWARLFHLDLERIGAELLGIAIAVAAVFLLQRVLAVPGPGAMALNGELAEEES